MENYKIIDFVVQNKELKESFYICVQKKYDFDGYINTALFYKKSWRQQQYYNNTYEELEQLAKSKSDYYAIFNKIISIVIVNSKAIGKEERDQVTTSFIKEYIDYISKTTSFRDGYFLHKPNYELRRITSLCDYFSFLTCINNNERFEIFFRGQSDINYLLLPSVYRNKKWYTKEQYLYNSITRMCPKDFNGFSNHVDNLVEMQHYELPTRLLDITKNALVALLFACMDDNQKDKDGEIIVFSEKTENIKFGKSDIVTILSCLPSFTEEEKRQLVEKAEAFTNDISRFNEQQIVQRLLHEIKTEKPAFRDIINPKDLARVIVALPALHNNRIIKQSGAFIITGLFDYSNFIEVSKQLNKLRYHEKGTIPIYIIDSKFKDSIMRELELCDLNEGTIFPEIDHVSRYLKNNLKK